MPAGIYSDDGGGVITASNGLTLVSNNVKLGGALEENTTITDAAGLYTLHFSGTKIFKVTGKDVIGSNFPFWVNVDKTGLVYGTAAGATLGRGFRLQNNSAESFFDMGFDSNGLLYMSRVHDGPTGESVNYYASLRIDDSGRFAIGNNETTPLTTPTAYLHLAAGQAAAGFAPLKFTSGVNLTAPAAGAMEFNGTRLYFTPVATRRELAFTDNETFSGDTTISTLTTVATLTALSGVAVYGGSLNFINSPFLLGTISLYNDNLKIDAAQQIILETGNGFVIPTCSEVTLATDEAGFYVADIAAGNASIHAKTENGDIIKIYSIGGWGTPTGALDRTALAAYAGQTVSALYVQAEIQAIDNAVKKVSQQLAALITDKLTKGELKA
jgi:hypothetical protein